MPRATAAGCRTRSDGLLAPNGRSGHFHLVAAGKVVARAFVPYERRARSPSLSCTPQLLVCSPLATLRDTTMPVEAGFTPEHTGVN